MRAEKRSLKIAMPGQAELACCLYQRAQCDGHVVAESIKDLAATGH